MFLERAAPGLVARRSLDPGAPAGLACGLWAGLWGSGAGRGAGRGAGLSAGRGGAPGTWQPQEPAPPVAILEAGVRAAGSYLRVAPVLAAVACLASTFHCHADTISSLQVSVSLAAMRVRVGGGMGLRRPNQHPGAPWLRGGRVGRAGMLGSLESSLVVQSGLPLLERPGFSPGTGRLHEASIPAVDFAESAARGSWPVLGSSPRTHTGAPVCLAPPSPALARGERPEVGDLGPARPSPPGDVAEPGGGRSRLGDSRVNKWGWALRRSFFNSGFPLRCLAPLWRAFALCCLFVHF